MSRWKRGVALGATANTILSLVEPVERALLGRTPPYHAAAVAERLVDRHPTAPVSSRTLAFAIRWGYGSALGVAFAAARPVLPRSRLAAGLLFGALLTAFERAALPRTGLTPPVAEWTREERVALTVHATVWSLAAATVDGRGRHSAR
jgi:hypothetical protein